MDFSDEGRVKVEQLRSKLERLTEEVKSSPPGSAKRVRSVAEMSRTVHQFLGKDLRVVSDEKDLVEILGDVGTVLVECGEFQAAAETGFKPAASVSKDVESRVLNLVEASRSIAKAVSQEEEVLRVGKLGRRTNSHESITQGLELLQQVHFELGRIPSTEAREPYYWIVFNCTIVCLSLAEPCIALGLAEPVVKHVNLGILAMESQVSLCTFKYLPWRKRLYAASINSYLQMGNPQAAIKAATRLIGQLVDLYRCEEQVTPIPEETEASLQSALRFASVALGKAKLWTLSSQSADSETMKKETETLLKEHIGIDCVAGTVSQGQVESYTTFLILSDYLDGLQALLTLPMGRTIMDQHEQRHRGFDEVAATVARALDILLRAFEETPIDASAKKSLTQLAHLFLKHRQWKGLEFILEKLASVDEGTADLQLLKAVYMLKCTDPKPNGIGLPEDVQQGLQGAAVAEIEGRLVPVCLISYLADVLLYCTKADQLCKTHPDVLVDAALMLWSPFCTAMLDTIGQTSLREPLHPALRHITQHAVDCVYTVLHSCHVQDLVLRTGIALRLAHLLYSSDTNDQDSHRALQVLRHALINLRIYRAWQVKDSTEGIAFALLAETCKSHPLANEIETLAALETDLLAMLFDVELELSMRRVSPHESPGKKKGSHSKKKTQVQATEADENGLTITLKNEVQGQASPSKVTEQRLLKECRKNKYSKAILLMTMCLKRDKAKYEEKLKLFVRASTLLKEAEQEEKALLEQLNWNEDPSSVQDTENNTDVANTLGSDQLPAPVLLRQSCSEITVRIQPFVRSVSKKSPPASYYVLYGKPAGSGTDVSLTNTDLVGTGIPLDPDNLVVTVRGLEPNESYVFAAAAFDAQGKILSPGIGSTSLEARALSPLPMPLCQGICAKLAVDANAHVVEDQAHVFASLHHSVREKITEHLKIASSLVAKVIGMFVKQLPSGPLWSTNLHEDFRLDKSHLELTSQPVLQMLVHCILLRDKLLRKPNARNSLAGLRKPLTWQSLSKQDFITPMAQQVLESTSRVQYLIIGLTVSCMLNDHVLILETAAKAYQHLVPLLQTKMFPIKSLQALTTIVLGLRKVPTTSWTESAYETYSRCCFEIIRFSKGFREVNFAESVLLEGPLDKTDDSDDNVVLGEQYERFPRIEAQEESLSSRSLAAILQLYVQVADRERLALLKSTYTALQLVPDFDQSDQAQNQTPNRVSHEEVVCIELARAQQLHDLQAFEKAQQLLQIEGFEYSEQFYDLVIQLCRTSLHFKALEDAHWADRFQQMIWDVDPASPTFPKPLVQDVLHEENEEKDEPLEAMLALVYPFSADPDPLGLAELEQWREEQFKAAEALEGAQELSQDKVDEEMPSSRNPQDQDISSHAEEAEKQVQPEESEEERAARLLQDAGALAAKEHRFAVLQRRERFLQRKALTPLPEEQKQLVALSELEAIKGYKLIADALEVDVFDLVPPQTQGSEHLFTDGVLQEGPRTDLKWKPDTSAGESGASHMVPPLNPLSRINEMKQNTAEDAMATPFAMERSFNEQQFQRAVKSTPKILHLLARALVRARWAQCWRQVEKIGKLLFNSLEFASVSPTQFSETAVCEEACVAFERQLSSRSETPSARTADKDASKKKQPSKAPPTPKAGKGKPSKADTAAAEMQDSTPPEVPTVEPSEMLYDWRPLFRATSALVDCLEVVRNGKSGHEGMRALLESSFDLFWVAQFASFCVQVLFHLKRWAQLVSLGQRILVVFDNADDFVSPILPLVIFAQKSVTEKVIGELEQAQLGMTALEQAWAEQNQKKKKRKERKKRLSSAAAAAAAAQAEIPTEEELAYNMQRAEKQEEIEFQQKRVDLLQSELDRLQKLQEAVARDRETAKQALEKAQTLRKKALLEFISPGDAELSWLVPQTGFPTKRSASTQRTGRSRAKSIQSKASKFSKKSNRSRANDAFSVLTRHTQEPEVDPDAEFGMKGYAVSAAVSAYEAAIQIMRKKQENTLLAQSLCELGDLYACQGGKEGWKKARKSWDDGADAVLQEVECIRTWRKKLTTFMETNPPVGIDDTRLLESPELSCAQSLISKVGMLGCFFGALNLCKVGHFCEGGNQELRFEYSRLAGLLFTACFSASPVHPTRKCDYACYSCEELFPLADQALLYSNLPKSVLVSALRETADNLAWSCCAHDKLLALPMLTLVEYFATRVHHSSRMVAEARLSKANVLTELGLLREASWNIWSVLTGTCFGMNSALVVEKSLQVSKEALKDHLETLYDLQSKLPQVCSSRMPWDVENIKAMRALLGIPQEGDIDQGDGNASPEDLAASCNPLPFVEKKLGPGLTRLLQVRRLELVTRLLTAWSPIDGPQTIAEAKSILRNSAQSKLEVLIVSIEQQSTRIIQVPRRSGLEEEEEEEAEPKVEMDEVEQDVALGSVLNRVLLDSKLCKARLLVCTGSLKACVEWILSYLGEARPPQNESDALGLDAPARQDQVVHTGRSRGSILGTSPMHANEMLFPQPSQPIDRSSLREELASHRVCWWLASRYTLLECLYVLKHYDELVETGIKAYEEAQAAHEVQWACNIAWLLGWGYYKLGEIELALETVQSASRAGVEKTLAASKCLLFESEILKERAAQTEITSDERKEALKMAAKVALDEMASLAFFPSRRVSTNVSQSMYLDALHVFPAVSVALAPLQFASEQDIDSATKDVEQALHIVGQSPSVNKWLKQRLLLQMSDIKMISNDVASAQEVLEHALKVFVEAGCFDLVNLRKVCLHLFVVLSALGEESQGQAQRVLEVAQLASKTHNRLAQLVSNAKQGKTAELKDTSKQFEIRSRHMPSTFVSQLEENETFDSLLYMYLSSVNERLNSLDINHQNMLQSVHQFLCAVSPEFKEQFQEVRQACENALALLHAASQEGSAGIQAPPSQTSKASVVVQWLEKDSNDIVVKSDNQVTLLAWLSSPQATTKFLQRDLPRESVFRLQRAFGKARVAKEDSPDPQTCLASFGETLADATALVTFGSPQLDGGEEALLPSVNLFENAFNTRVGIVYTVVQESGEDAFFAWLCRMFDNQ